MNLLKVRQKKLKNIPQEIEHSLLLENFYALVSSKSMARLIVVYDKYAILLASWQTGKLSVCGNCQVICHIVRKFVSLSSPNVFTGDLLSDK